MSDKPGDGRPGAPAANAADGREQSHEDETVRRRRFARSLVRSVFGRNYWDDKLEAELCADVLTRKKKKK